MFDGDLICRAALYPKFVTPDGTFDPESLLRLQSSKNDTVYSLSVASKFLCRDAEGVHTYGRGAAKVANDRFIEIHSRPPSPVTEQVHYLGYYELFCGDVRSLKMQYYKPRCYWLPEHGSDAHFQVDFDLCGEGTKKERRQDRRAAIGILFDRMWGPERHICPDDEPHRAALEAVDLPHTERV